MDPFSSATAVERRLVAAAARKHVPLGGGFELLPLCNMDCRMCFLRLSPAEMAAHGRLRTADEWLTLARDAAARGLLFLTVTGGEPLLFPDFPALWRGLCGLGLILTLNTNGTLLTEQAADLFAAHMPRRINVTLYGASDETYARLCRNPAGFTQTMRGIRLLLDRGIQVKLNASVTPDNAAELDALYAIADDLGVPLMPDSYMFPCARKGCMPFDHTARLSPADSAAAWMHVKEKELPPEAFAEMCAAMAACRVKDAAPAEGLPPEPIPCRAGSSSFWVNWQGRMTPCVFLDAPAPDVFTVGFDEAWETVRAARDAMCMPPACTACPRRPFCAVCAAAVRWETGALENPPPYVCAITDEKLRLAAERA